MMKNKFFFIFTALTQVAFGQRLELPSTKTVFDAPPKNMSSQFVGNGAETVLWSEDFANGIPAGWLNYGTAQGVTDPDAKWEYRGPQTTPNTSVGSRGAYSGLMTNPNYTSINSATKSNGFVVFDSDYLDNAAVAGNFCGASGTSVLACAPHEANLETAVIDLSNNTQVDLKFTQYYRRFAGPGGVQSVPATYIDFSTNGGLSWFGNVMVNSSISVNSATPANDLVNLSIGSYVGGHDSVKIRFRFEGDYYFWQLDDIQLVGTPNHRLEFTFGSNGTKQDIFFSNSANKPKNGHFTLSQNRSIQFRTNVRNTGLLSQNIQLLVNIYDQLGNLVATPSSNFVNLAPGDTLSADSLNTRFNLWVPASHSAYSLVYKVVSPNVILESDTFNLYVQPDYVGADFGKWDNSMGPSTSTYHGDGFQMATLLNFPNPDTLVGARVYLSSNTQAGGIIELGVYDSVAFSSSMGFNSTYLRAYGQKVVSANDVLNGFVDFTFSSGVSSGSYLPSGNYFYNLTMYDNQGANYLAVRNDQTFPASPGSKFFYLPNAPTSGWYSGYSNSRSFNAPWIRAKLASSSNFPCFNSEIVTASDVSVCGPDTAVLSASGATNSASVLWLNSTNQVVGSGSSFTVQQLQGTTDFGVTAFTIDSSRAKVTFGPSYTLTGGYGNFTNGQWFSALSAFVLDSVTVVSNGPITFAVRLSQANGSITSGNSGAELQKSNWITVSSAGVHKVYVGLHVSPGSYFMNFAWQSGSGQLFRATSGGSYPYVAAGIASIDSVQFGSASSQVRAYYAFNWVVRKGCLGLVDPVRVQVNTLPMIYAGVDQTICSGTPLVLSGTGGTSYQWDNGVINGIRFFPTQTLSYVLTGTDSLGCTSTDTVNVMVNQSPLQPSASDVAYCRGALASPLTVAGTPGNQVRWYNFPVTSGLSLTVTTPMNLRGPYNHTNNGAAAGWGLANLLNPVNAVYDTVVMMDDSTQGINTVVGIDPLTGNAYPGIPLKYEGCNLDTTSAWQTNRLAGKIVLIARGTCEFGSKVFLAERAGARAVIIYNRDNNLLNAGPGVFGGLTSIPFAFISRADGDALRSAIEAGQVVKAFLGTNDTLNGAPLPATLSPGQTSYFVSQTSNLGCMSPFDTVVVTVNALPTVGAGADVTVCAGTSATLSGSGATTYSWNNNVTNGTAFTPTATTTYTVTGTDANGCVNLDSVVVTVNAMPDTTVTVTGSLAFCPGGSVSLSAASGLGYLWNTGDTSQSVVLSQSGTTYAVVTTVNGCVDTTASFTALLYPGADTTLTWTNLIFCASDSATITAAGGQSYAWNTGDTTQSITVNQTGNYGVTVTTVNGCVGVTDTVSTTVVPDVVLPQILGDLYGWFASGDTVNFSVVNTGGYTLNWGITGGAITGGQGGDTISVVWGAADSTAAIWVVVSNGVCQDSAYLNLVISGLGTGEGIGSKAMAYPNPNSGVFTLEWSNIDAKRVLIYNGVGQVVASQPIDQGSTSTVIDLSAKAAGIYRAVIYGIEGTVTLPVYVRH